MLLIETTLSNMQLFWITLGCLLIMVIMGGGIVATAFKEDRIRQRKLRAEKARLTREKYKQEKLMARIEQEKLKEIIREVILQMSFKTNYEKEKATKLVEQKARRLIEDKKIHLIEMKHD